MSEQAPDAQPLSAGLAIALVTGTSGAVLVLEILAMRVMAPYVGTSLETFTAIIGTILLGIAVGARVGGRLADEHDPRHVITWCLLLGGALAIASIPIVRILGGSTGAEAGGMPSILLAAAGFLPSATVLSAIPPAVVKLQLRNLDETGDVVGSLSAWGTGGAIAGTFLAGFVLVAYAAVSTLIITTGILLVATGLAFAVTQRQRDPRTLAVGLPVALVALGGYAVTESPCDTQTAYYCVAIVNDPDRADGRTLVLDDLRHSYVALDDPTHLEFWYVRQIVEAIDTYAPDGSLDVVAIGGGAMTVPTYLVETRPASDVSVLEIDPDLVDIVGDDLAVEVDRFDVRTGDGRLTMRQFDDDSADVVVGDAFGSRSVPWHLTTREFLEDIDRVLRDDGIYVVNVIDGADQNFLRAETATIREVFPHVAVMQSEPLTNNITGNAVILASGQPFDPADWDDARIARDDPGRLVTDIDDFTDGARILVDDFAPVDQLIVSSS